MLRIHGEMVPLRVAALTSEQVLSMLYSIMTEKQRVDYEQDLEVDFAVHLAAEGRFRVNAFNTINGPCAAMRSIPSNVQTLEELRLPKVLENLTLRTKGLVLVTGPTGSGKSTTLAAMIDHIN